jgi:hypothetical protein
MLYLVAGAHYPTTHYDRGTIFEEVVSEPQRSKKRSDTTLNVGSKE